MTVETVTSEGCRAGLSPAALDNTTSGYIASVVLSDTPACNDGRQTWTISAEPGQQISLKLYDFFAEQPTAAPPSDRQLNHHTISRGTDNFCPQLQDFCSQSLHLCSRLCGFLPVCTRLCNKGKRSTSYNDLNETWNAGLYHRQLFKLSCSARFHLF